MAWEKEYYGGEQQGINDLKGKMGKRGGFSQGEWYKYRRKWMESQ